MRDALLGGWVVNPTSQQPGAWLGAWVISTPVAAGGGGGGGSGAQFRTFPALASRTFPVHSSRVFPLV